MKRILFFLFLILIASPMDLIAQIHCPIPCDSEAFPYWFCEGLTSPHIIVKCSIHPNLEIGLTPAKTHMPGCVNVIPVDASLQVQPTEAVPGPPTPPDKSDRSIYFRDDINPGPYIADAWDSHYQWQLAHDQWVSDSTNFMSGDPLIEPDTNDHSLYPTEGDRQYIQFL